VIEQAIDTSALMLGSDKSRGYGLGMICADFLAEAHLQEDGDTEMLYLVIMGLYEKLPTEIQNRFHRQMSQAA
jgi:hypothetical protein